LASFVTIARILKTRGIRGEVSSIPLTDFPERFASTRRVRVVCGSRESWELLERHWYQGKRLILKFEGRDRPEEVKELIGGEVQVPEGKRFPVPEETFYHSDLIGCRVWEGEQKIGVVIEIFETGAEGANLVIQADSGERLMLPLVRQYVQKVDIESRSVRVEIPEGLWEVAEPKRSVNRRFPVKKSSKSRPS
jgi:16S rRNA processing protein RimM